MRYLSNLVRVLVVGSGLAVAAACSSSDTQPAGDGGSAGASGAGTSWNQQDPPTQDTSKANGYCQKSKDMFTQQLSYYRDTAAPRADLNELYHMERIFHGLTGVAEVTGDTQIVSDLLDISLKVVGAGKDLDGDGFLDYFLVKLKPLIG
jgi:hypothetical protein